jgi:heat shock protein HslJ
MRASGAKFSTADGMYTLWEHQDEFTFAQNEQPLAVCHTASTDPAATGALSGAEAREIAAASCVKGGEPVDGGVYDETQRTWSFTANLNAVREGCSALCVVQEDTRTAEVVWNCAGEDITPPVAPPGEGSSTSALVGRTWVFVDVQGSGDAAFKPEDPSTFTLSFHADGSVAIGTDCNTMGATFTVDGTTLTFTDMVSTLMYCEGSRESEWSALISDTKSHEVTNRGTLDLHTSTGMTVHFQ